jgi:hypothetical protein
VSEDAVAAVAADEGITDETIYTPEWKFWESRGQMNARIGYEKDPRGWCERVLRWLGPDHPPGIKRALLSRE